MKIYLATSLSEDFRSNAEQVVKFLRSKDFDVYYPLEHKIPHAWDYPNSEWGLMVFSSDISAIESSDFVILLSYGRNSTAGANWEAGFAFGIGKKVIVVEMNNHIQSLMVANGRYASVKGINGLITYIDDTDLLNNLYPSRTMTEQK